jgi:hypothetical protein
MIRSFIPEPDPDSDFLPISDPRSQIPYPGVKRAPNPGSRIRIRNNKETILIVGDGMRSP